MTLLVMALVVTAVVVAVVVHDAAVETTATIAMPFGSTCLPSGCTAPVSWLC